MDRRPAVRGIDARHFLLRVQFRPEAEPDWGGYPFNVPAVRAIETIEFHPAVTCFVGENGSGKSTIVEALASIMDLNPEGGTQNFRFATRASHSSLASALRAVRGPARPDQHNRFFLRAESFYNVATQVEDLGLELEYWGGKSFHEQSHGESFMALMLHRFGPRGFYILDEPESALSPARQLAMLARMHQLIEDGSQFIIATHAPILMAYPGARIYALNEQGITEQSLRETDHYRIAIDFLRDPEARIGRLLAEEAVERS